jgi:chloramphenicol O-acetyltransferase type A
MNFKTLDVSQWKRREYFEYYLNQVPCTYSMTLNLDLTELLKEIKKRDIKLYPTMIYLLSMIVNKREEFRMAIERDSGVGVFDFLHPSYTIFQSASETFTNIWTEYNPLFPAFYKQYVSDVKNYGTTKSFMGKPDMPSNVFTISSIPWVSFTGFNLNLPKAADYLLPIFTTGKYFQENDKIWLPIAIQVHHAVCDGFHLARFVHELQEAMDTFFQTMKNF